MATAIHLTRAYNTHDNEVATTEVNLAAQQQAAGSREQITIGIDNLSIHGFINKETGVANFLNIPYARIQHRFGEAHLIDPRKEDGVIEATKYGPCCPQLYDIIHDQTSHLYPKVIDASNSGEFTCLSVNIYGPPANISSGKKLPVFVWIHGGAFTYGDASDEYDGNYLVRHSMSIGKPVVVAAFNYRVGPYGFLTSKELKEEALSRGEKGYANLGFHDQRLGLQWVQRNIHYFGGDGYEITAAGESGGAYSILTHIRSDFPAFQRAFIMSAPSLQPVPFSTAQERFDGLISRLGISLSAPAGDKLAALRSLTAEELNRLQGPGVSPPTYDPEFSPDQEVDAWLEDARPFPSWLKGVVIGNTREEAALFLPSSITGADAIALLKKVYGDTDMIRELLDAYKFKKEDSPGSGIDDLIRITTHCAFTICARTIATTHPEVPVSLYSFDQTDPFETSPWKGRAFHSLGNSMLFGLPTVAGPNADSGTRATAERFGESAIKLCYGEQPWEPYANGSKMMVFDGEKSGLVQIGADHAPWTVATQSKQRMDLLKTRALLLIRDAIETANNFPASGGR